MVFRLTKKLAFPDPHYGDEDGLLAVGGDLSIDRLILAYSNGIFPWYAFRENQIQWWCPMDRFVIFPDEIHISHSMRTLINKGKYRLTFNQAFREVIQTCGNLRIDMEGAWLGKDMMDAYTSPPARAGICRQRRGMGQRTSHRRTLWSDIRALFFRRKHVFVGIRCLKTGTDTSCRHFPVTWRSDDRLPVRNSPSPLNGWQAHQL